MTPVRVVLVEDNDMFREMLSMLFEKREEVEVVAAVASGDEAPQVCADVRPDVVLMDYRMPGLNGADATRAVLAACPTARVVLLSASVTGEERDEVLAAGAVACILKDDELDSIVGAVCEAALA